MSKLSDRKMAMFRCLSGLAAGVVTFAIVLSLDSLSDRYSAATIAKAASTVVVAAAR